MRSQDMTRHSISVRRRNLTLVGLVSILALSFLLDGVAKGQTPDFSRQRASCDAQAASGVPQSRLALMARGFNLTGWLDGANTRRPDQSLLAELRGRGFSHIRLPVTAERLMEAFSSADTISRDLEELDRAIDTLIGVGFGVSLDMHPGDKLGRLHVGDPQTAFGLIDGLWRRLARRYAARPPDLLFFEVLNEPGVSRAIWDNQGPRLAKAIRNEAPEHTIVYGGANFQRIDGLA